MVLGICNGFQVLMRLGILTHGSGRHPGFGNTATPATLTWNDHGRFEIARSICALIALLNPIRVYSCEASSKCKTRPMAHAEGKFLTASPEILRSLSQSGRLALRACVLMCGRCKQSGTVAGTGAGTIFPCVLRRAETPRPSHTTPTEHR